MSGPRSDEVEQTRVTAAELEQYVRATEVEPDPEVRSRILAALADEPVPAPLAAMATAAHEHRGRAVLAGLRDVWRVAWSGGRPVGIRLSAALAVVLLVAGVGSASGLAAAGAWSVLHPSAQAPIPSPSLPPPSGHPTATPSASSSPATSPSEMPSAMPTGMPRPSATTMPMPTATPMMPSSTPAPTPMSTHAPTSTPMSTHHPAPSSMPGETRHP